MTEDAGSRATVVRELEAEFGELVTRFRRIAAENAERVSPGLMPGAYKVFSTIARRKTVTLSALAEVLIMDKGQLSRAVRELETRGLVTREPDPADGRSSLLSPTEFGVERLEDAHAPRQSLVLSAVENWPLEDLEALTRLLRALSDGVERSQRS
ncbi:MAG: MarR family transcriptional regulator [Microbacterium sp.]